MASIMQGTTPSVTIKISPEDFSVSDVTRMELYVKNGDTITTYTADDLTVDAETNSITKHFTESETTALDPKQLLMVQGRFWFNDEVVGINKIAFHVSDMMGVGVNG